MPSSSPIQQSAPFNYLQQHRQQSPSRAGNTTLLYLDGSSAKTVYNGGSSIASSSMESTQVQPPAIAPGHHRDKLDLIRDSLRPFEQPNEQFLPNKAGPPSSMNSSTGSISEPSEEVQKTMINALIQGGFDREAAYYALKLVNFNSVMDAAKVLSNIKQNLKQQHLQQPPASVSNGYVSPSNQFVDTQQPLSSQSRAALSRYGVVSNSSATPFGTTINIGGRSSRWQQQAGPSHHNNKPVVVTQSLPQPVYRELPYHSYYESSFGSESSSRSSESPPVFGPSTNLEMNSRTAQCSSNWIDQKRYLKAAQSIPYTHPHQFTEEYEERTPLPTSSRTPDHHTATAILRRQTQMPTSSPTVIKIERNTSERIPAGFSIKPLQTTSSSRQPVSTTIQVNPATRRDVQSSSTAIRMNNAGSTTFLPSLPIQNIRISSEQGPAVAGYVNYTDQLCCSSNTVDEPVSSRNRCVSPLPEFVANRLKIGNYERFVKPCRAPMFRFFMEQHIEKLVQQYRERNQRAMQLTKEMEMAGLTDQMKDQMLRLLRQKESKYIRLKRQKMNKNMFDMIRHIGVGAFGKVTLVRKKDTSEIYAMKTLSKEDVIQKQQAAHVKAERDILAEANSNWIVKLYFSFQDVHNLYFIMEYVPGGDMMQLLINKGIFSERLARFYVAELTCAIEYVHSLGFIHRDIKPDNILIDKNGHIKLTDFGLCTGLRWTHDKRHYVIYDEEEGGISHLREDSFTLPSHLANGKDKVKLLEYRHHKKRNQAHSVVGTGNYMAPEVIKKIGHTQLCDWWSVGVILYEMVYGRPPFLSQYEDANETQYMIVNWRRYLHLENPIGARLSRSCVDFIAKLCCDTDNRLGSNNGAKDIKAHIWFRDIDFINLRSTRAEFIPRVEHPEDTRNFDTFEVTNGEFEGLMVHPNGQQQQPGQPSSGQQKYNPAFFDFTFRHFFASDQSTTNSSEQPLPPGFRSHQSARPSLAPLIEAQSGSNGAAAKVWTAARKTVPAPPAPSGKH